MDENQSGSSSKDELYFLQFNGQIDKTSYREYRVKSNNLACPSKNSQSTSGRILQGLKRTLECHDYAIARLEDEIRYHQLIKSQWALLKESTREQSAEILARILDSSMDFIENFENENFGPTCSWAEPFQTDSPKSLKNILRSVKRLNRNGIEIKESPPSKIDSSSVKNGNVAKKDMNNGCTEEKSSQTADQSSRTKTTESQNFAFPSPDSISIEISQTTQHSLGSSSSQSGSSSRSSLNNKTKGKKGKKGNKGPKMTLEEIEAIKKKKKEDADRAFEKKHKEMQEHLSKVEKSERHKIHRRVAETALEILRRGSGILPPEIKELNQQLEGFVKLVHDGEKFRLRDEYLKTRVEELTRTLMGPELANKMELMAVYENVIERSSRLQHYLMFMGSLERVPEEFKEFEQRTIAFYLKGYEEDEEIKNKDIDERFKKFQSEFLTQIPESERWSYAQDVIDTRISQLKEIEKRGEMTRDDLYLQKAYIGIDNIVEVFNTCCNVLSFLQFNKTNPAFHLMEAWFLESRRPPALEN